MTATNYDNKFHLSVFMLASCQCVLILHNVGLLCVCPNLCKLYEVSANVKYVQINGQLSVLYSIKQHQAHQVALCEYICSDNMRDHLFAMEHGTVQSHYLRKYNNNIHRRRGILQLSELGFGPLSDNDVEVCCSCCYK